MAGAPPQGPGELFAAGPAAPGLAAQLARLKPYANPNNVLQFVQPVGVPLQPAPVMAGAPPQGAAELFAAGPARIVRDHGLAARLARMERAFESHVGRMRPANAAPKPVAPARLAPAQPVRWAASLRTAAARLARRSAGVPRAVRLGAARSFLCRRKLRAIRTDGLPKSAADVWRERQR